MPSPEFTFRPVLQELTSLVNSEQLDPYEAYCWLYERQIALTLEPESYLSSSITSGGHARDDSLEIRDIVARNTRSAMLLADQLAIDGQVRAESAIEPVVVGKTHWNQAQFMEFWLSVIGGFQFTPGFIARGVDKLRTSAGRSFSEVDLDLDLMISRENAERRAIEYFKMSHAFAKLITDGAEARPINTLVRMIDTDMSLGSQTERAFARQIGTKVMNICVVKPARPEDLEDVNRVLARDTARLIQFGATVFDTTNNRVRLSLMEAAV